MASYELSKTKRNLIVSVMLISAFVAILNQTLLIQPCHTLCVS